MAEITIQDVAQYLAEHGYATWSELTTRKMLTEDGMWTRLQSNYDSTHLIDPRYITFPTVDLSEYAKDADIKQWVQQQGYATTVPSLSGYATQQWVQQQGYLTQHQSLSGYATQSWVTLSIQTAVAGFASQSFVQNNYLSKATFDELFEKVNIGTEQSPVYVIHAKLGLYSDSFISAAGVGAPGGGGGGGLSWENLASTVAAAGEQVNICHLTEALAGYATTSMLGGYALTSQLPTKLSDLTDDLGSSPTHTHSQYLTALPSHNHDSRYYISGGTVHLGNESITPLTSHQSLAGYATTSQLAGYLPLSGGTLTGDIESQNIIPVTDNEYSLGTSSKRWSIIRTMKADFAGDIYTHGKIYAYGNIQPMPNSNNAYPQLGTSAARWANVLTSGVNSAGHIIPSTTETYQLGTSQYRWNNVVTKSINATGTSSLAALSVSGSATFNNGINVATGSLTIGSCTISWDSSVGMLRFSTGIYSDVAVTAGGVGTSGGGGGGGLSWENLASTVAAAGEQVNICHLTEALAGYATTSMLGGYALTSQLPTKLSDLTDDLGSSPTHTHSQYLTALPSHNHDSRYYISGGTVHLGNGSITPLTSHQSLAGYATTSQLAGYLPLSGGTLTGQLRVKAGSTVIGPSLDDTTYRYYHAVYFGTHGTDHMDFYEGEFNFYGNGGGKPTVKIGGYRVLDTSDAGSLSVAFATNCKHIEPLAYASSNGAGMTVAQVKSWIAGQFDGISDGVGSNVYVSADAIWNWYDDSHTVVDSSVYSFIKIGGGYDGTYWGQWMLSSYNDSRVGFVGRSEGSWSNIQWIALLTDNVASATRLQYTRYLWGQAFDGTGNVSGPLTGVTSVSSSDSGERFRMAYSTSKQTLSGETLPFSGSTNVLKIEHYNGESAGIAISEPDGVCVFGPGDGDYIFSVYDEDDLEECLFYVDGDGVTCAKSLKIGSCEIEWDSSAQMLRFSTGIYSVGAVTAGGVGASGSGSGGGLSWANLASTVAAAGEQVNICHLTEALAGYALTSQLPTKLSDLTDDLGSSPTHTHSQYLTALPLHNHDSRYYISGGTVYIGNSSITPVTSLGYRPIIGASGASTTWLSENYGVILPLTSAGGGNYTLDYATICANYVTLNTTQTISGTKTFSSSVTASGFVKTNYNNANYLLTGNGGAKWLPDLFSSFYVSGSTLYCTMGGTQRSVTLPSGSGGSAPSNMVTTNTTQTITAAKTFNQEIYMSGTRSIVFNDDSGIAANGSDELELYGNNGVRITSGNLVVEGKVTATGFINSSDLRMKNLFGDVGLTVSEIAAMPAVRFRWNSGRDTQAMHVGTIAQAWQTLLPEVVLEGSDGLLSMDYASAALVSAIVTARAVTDHERRILDLEKRLNIKD